eukprot:TRINITY_DN8236_c0_g2_i1.p1 TRINITY_DN8236_c0_g2~~TRINITY_DN8236_c0_g2_i1.p1  ORF type:complete len:674 (+),score=42.37 TRINITY_DN8236_c0_g2_i1:120-2141(+)
MEWAALTTLIVLGTALTVLAKEAGPPDQVMFASLLILWQLGIISTSTAFAGFSNPAVITVGCLFVIARAVERSKVVDRAAQTILGRKTSEAGARLRLCIVAMSMSAFMNNTPLVALLMPIVRDWARSRQFAASRFLIPLSYSVIMGGLFSLIGSSTNLVINGLLEQIGEEPFGFFAPGFVALPVALCGVTYLLIAAPFLLPNNRGGLFRALREQTDTMITQLEFTSDCCFLGDSVFDALEDLGIPDEALVKMFRVCRGPVPRQVSKRGADKSFEADGIAAPLLGRRPSDVGWQEAQVSSGSPSSMMDARNPYMAIFPVPLHETVSDGDVLLLSLGKDALTHLIKRRPEGLKIGNFRPTRVHDADSEFVEVVLAFDCPLVGCQTSTASRKFMDSYRAAMIALRTRSSAKERGSPQTSRHSHSPFPSPSAFASGEANSAEGRKILTAGDAALLLVPTDVELPRADFLTITRVAALPQPVTCFDFVPTLLLAVGMVLMVFELASMLHVATTLSAVCILGKWVPHREVRQVVDWHILILIGSALGIAQAVQASGLSGSIASLVRAAGLGPAGALAMLFLCTMLLTEIITNNAAAALGFALAVDLTHELGLTSVRPFAMAVMIASQSSYACPLGYTTNLMVFASGGYTFGDFFRVGIGMDIIYLVSCSLLIPIVWGLA